MTESDNKKPLVLKRKMVVQNDEGLHARPAGSLVSVLNKFDSDMSMERDDGYKVNAKSIIGVLTLAAVKGTTLTVIAEGKDAEEALDATEALFTNNFGVEEQVTE